MSDLDHRIASARQHIEDGRRIVARQRELEASPHSDTEAASLLATFEQSLAIFERDLERLLAEQAKLKP